MMMFLRAPVLFSSITTPAVRAPLQATFQGSVPPPQRSGQSALPPHVQQVFFDGFEKQIAFAQSHSAKYLNELHEALTQNPEQFHALILGADGHDQVMLIPA